MAISQSEKFDRWLSTAPRSTRYFVEQIQKLVTPDLEAAGFHRLDSYGGKGIYSGAAGTLAFQKADGAEWPSIEFQFNPKRVPLLNVVFGVLPERCQRMTTAGTLEDVPRSEATLVNARAWFLLCRPDRRNAIGGFGYRWWSIRPEATLDAETKALKASVPWLLSVLGSGIPASWYDGPPRVDPQAFRAGPAWNITAAVSQS